MISQIFYAQTLFISGLCSPFSQWPASSGLRGEWPWFESRLGHFLVTFHFQLSYSFFVGWLRLVGLGFSMLVLRFSFSFYVYLMDEGTETVQVTSLRRTLASSP